MGTMLVRELATQQYKAVLGAAVDAGDNAEAAFKNCDALIDFTSPEGTLAHAALAHQYKKPLVVGTTGLGDVEQAGLLSAAQKAPVFYAANMSLGVNILLSLVSQAAARLSQEFDIEIFEAHHRDKVDAPSGTALALGHAAAKGRGIKLEDAMIPSRYGHTGKRITGSIGMAVFRGGDVVGEHTVMFAGAGERLELTHKASDRAIFAKGAIKAALWLKDKPAGFYSMADMLGL